MSDPMAEIRASFFIECEELLESLQDGLQLMDDGDTDSETINIVFRAVHSIKGGAGAFGLDDLVHFAHRFETAMDEVRAGRFTPDAEAIRLFFTCADILADLVRAARDGDQVDDGITGPVLENLDNLPAADTSDDALPALDMPGSSPDTAIPPMVDSECKGFSVKFKPEDALYASGNEPLYLFRALRDLGDISVICHCEDLPQLDSLNPDTGHLSWDMTIHTEEPEQAVREVFEFVDGLCLLEINALTGDQGSAPSFEATERSPSEQPPVSAASEMAPPPQTESAQNLPENAATASVDVANTTAAKTAATPTQPRATVRVDLERIDRLVNLVGELVINQAMLSQSVAEAGLPPNSPVSTGLEEFLQLTRDIQESVMMIRAQPIKSLFQRMGRIVREASASVGKEVRLRTDGENTEVDKTVIERLADPLTHMIRNAVDHGLESTEKRLEAGKSREGHVTLTAQHRSGRIVIEVTDDGGGINRERVKEKAIQKGLIPEDAQLSDSDIDNLLFLPGFSTAAEISNLSGRGVGMDVVKSSIQALGGRISITSQEGKGTTFSISLPLTLAVLDGTVVRVADETLVVPLRSRRRTRLPHPARQLCWRDCSPHWSGGWQQSRTRSRFHRRPASSRHQRT